jgi:AcrR family transcriptional regulator
VSVRGKYKLRRRAQEQENTRQRIIEAAVSLHSQVGPARTTITEVAKLAGVQRPTVYRHFPDQLSLFAACSGYGLIAHPLPDPERWSKVADPAKRRRVGLDELYEYYRNHAERLSKILGDAETMPTSSGQMKWRSAHAWSKCSASWPAQRIPQQCHGLRSD